MRVVVRLYAGLSSLTRTSIKSLVEGATVINLKGRNSLLIMVAKVVGNHGGLLVSLKRCGCEIE